MILAKNNMRMGTEDPVVVLAKPNTPAAVTMDDEIDFISIRSIC